MTKIITSKIMKCNCEHRFQDEQYDKKNRVHTRTKGNNGRPGWRCTVCGKEKKET